MKAINIFKLRLFKLAKYIKIEIDNNEYLGIDENVPVNVGKTRLMKEKILTKKRISLLKNLCFKSRNKIIREKLKIRNSNIAVKYAIFQLAIKKILK